MVLEANLFKITYFVLKLTGSVENKYAACFRMNAAASTRSRVVGYSNNTKTSSRAGGKILNTLIFLIDFRMNPATSTRSRVVGYPNKHENIEQSWRENLKHFENIFNRLPDESSRSHSFQSRRIS